MSRLPTQLQAEEFPRISGRVELAQWAASPVDQCRMGRPGPKSYQRHSIQFNNDSGSTHLLLLLLRQLLVAPLDLLKALPHPLAIHSWTSLVAPNTSCKIRQSSRALLWARRTADFYFIWFYNRCPRVRMKKERKKVSADVNVNVSRFTRHPGRDGIYREMGCVRIGLKIK